MTTAIVERDGVSLFTRIDFAEDPAAPWILLSNSLAADHRMRDPQVELLRRRYHVLRYDTRGHGQSDAPPGPYSFDELVADAAAVLDSQGVKRASFMGLSLGGMTGLGLALAHPDRMERLVACDCRADAPNAFVRSWDERIAVVDAKGLAGVLRPTLERWLAPGFRETHPETVRAVEAMILATAPGGWKGCAAALKRLDYRRRLPDITTPTLFIVGSEDTGAPLAVMRAMADATPGATLAVVEGGAHLPNIDTAEAFNRAVAPFLGLS